MSGIAYFNTLEPKQEYIGVITKLLRDKALTLTNIISKSNLTKTQVGCSLDLLIAENKIAITLNSKNQKLYSLVKDEL